MHDRSGFEVEMALHQRHKEDPFETYDLGRKKKPARHMKRKLRGFFSSSFSGGKWASVALPIIAFVLLVSVFVVKIVTDSRSVSDEQFRNENPLEVKENIARIQRDIDSMPEIEEVDETEPTETEVITETTTTETKPAPQAPSAVVMTPETSGAIAVKEYVYVATSVVNVREDASTDSELVGQVLFNQKLEKLGSKGDFYQIKTENGFEGYVHQDLVSSELSEAIVPGMQMYVQVGQAYIRSGGGTGHDIVGFGFKGTPLTVLEAGSEWSLIQTDTGLKGYMLNELFGPRKVERTRTTIETNAIRYVDYDVVYMRERATVDSEQIAALSMDERVVQLSSDGSWSKVETSDGIQGYVRNDLLRESAPVTPFATTNRNQYISVDVSNVRADASTESEVRGQVRQGEKVLQIKTDGTWSLIKPDGGVEGYVLNEFLTGVAPPAPPTSTAPTNPTTTNPPTNGSTAPAPTTPAPTTPAPTNPFRDISGTVYVKVDAANLRSEPSTSSVVVDTLYYGEAVQTLATNDSWTKVKTKEGASGYLSNSLFQNEEIKTAPPQASSKGLQAVEYAKQLLGVPYVYSGSSPNGVDCSGLTKYVYGKLGVYLYHGSNSQARSAYPSIPFSTSNYEATLLPGDLVFFSNSGGYGHVGIYVGNGQMIHAPQPGQVVRYESLYARNSYSPVTLVKRIFN